MRSLFEDKRSILLLSVLALGALTVLAIGLGEVPFREAQSFGRSDARDIRSIPLSLITAFADIPIWMHVGMWTLFILLVVLIMALISPELRWKLVKNLIRVAVVYWGFYTLITRYRTMLAKLSLDLSLAGGSQLSVPNGEALPEFAPPSSSSSLVVLVSFLVALLLVLIAWRMFVFWREYRMGNVRPIDRITKIARASLKDLSSGRDSTDVIMNCYYRMSDVVADKRKLERNAAVTPAEFAVQLERAGLPGDAVRRLTRLFEAVRYGGHKTGVGEVNEAVACLTAILHYCGEAV
jgi:hypothetical protein